MKHNTPIAPILLAFSLLHTAQPARCGTSGSPDSTREWSVGGRLTASVPEVFNTGEAINATLDFTEAPAVASRLGLAFHYLGDKGAYKGRLPESSVVVVDEQGGSAGPTTLDTPRSVKIRALVSERPADLTVAVLTLFLSPDGSWKNRSFQASFPIRPADIPADDPVWGRAVQNAMSQNGAPPDNEGAIEDYKPRGDYFAQREDDPTARSWRLAAQSLPPLDGIVNGPAPERPPYGLYCWAGEYERGAAEIAKIGIKSLRLAGPWADADEAMRLAAQNGVEVLFTLKAGADRESYKLRRDDFASDGEFLAAFSANVEAFVKHYGPGGKFERDTGLRTPLAVVEMWNEPNFFYMIGDLPVRKETEPLREALYPAALKAGHKASKSIAPDLAVAGFAAGGADSADIRFIENIFKSHPDIGEYFDILTTHPYTKGAPPEAGRVRPWGAYSIADNLAGIRRAMGGASVKPVWYSELGWHFAGKHGGQFETPPARAEDTITPDLHAAYITRMFAWAVRLGVGRVHVMHLHDADTFNSGLMTRDLQWRPAAHAIRHMIRVLPNPRLLRAISDAVDGLCIYGFRADGADPSSPQVIMAWNVAGPIEVKIPWPEDRAELSDMIGNIRTAEAREGALTLTVGPYPVYIRPAAP